MSAQPIVATLPNHPHPTREGVYVVEVPADKFAKLNAFFNADTFEKAEAARDARLDECFKSAEVALRVATTHYGTSGGRVFATLLASLYNGNRVKFDVSDLRCLDSANFEHALNVMRLSFETHSEPHTWFKGGGTIFEQLIADWKLEKKRRAAR